MLEILSSLQTGVINDYVFISSTGSPNSHIVFREPQNGHTKRVENCESIVGVYVSRFEVIVTVNLKTRPKERFSISCFEVLRF